MMKTLIVILGMILLLTACATQTPAAVGGAPFDPNLAAVKAQLTSDAAQSEAQLYSIMATSTAQAPIVAITQTAAAMAIQQQYWTVTAQSVQSTETAAMTATAQSWTPTPNATMTAVFAASYAEATKQANIAIEDNQRIERNRLVNKAKAFSIYAVGLVLLILAVPLAYVLIKRLAYIPNPVDERGKPHPMIEILEGTSWDIDRTTNGMLGTAKTFLKQLPQITSERQNQVTARAQLVDMQTRARRTRHLLADGDHELLDAETADMQGAELLLPEWRIIESWDGQSRPLGLGIKGIIKAQAASPHLLTTGGTGSGKTAFMLRTQATVSLAKGYQVINLGFSDSGFGVFNGHPNYHSIKLTQSSDVIDCLASVYKELKERKQIIGGESIEWDHWRAGELPPRPFVDVLIDELGNLADDIYTSEETSKEGAVKTMLLWRWMSMIAKEGRKVGIRFLAALQDPTAKSVNISFRRNCTLVSFQLGDASQSRSFIGVAGAELLQVGHFMTRNFSGNDGVVVGGGFAPSDDEIRAYLRQHAAQRTPAPTWIEGVTNDAPGSLTGGPQDALPPTTHQDDSMSIWVNGLDSKELKVLELYQAGGMSNAEIEELAYGYTNGRTARRVKSIIERYRQLQGFPATSATTTTTTTPNLPNFGAVAA